ncbi:hypothetical protein Tco_1054493 [Tanacetum coccineum]|uniref:Uncharacterized protein n=1 Tax=Tanacetum coccineum TaxID=301880 RepID=A0ABQ5GWY5_9ASTR
MCRRASAKLNSKWRFRKISMNFKAKGRPFLWIFYLDYPRWIRVNVVFGSSMTTCSQLGQLEVGRLCTSVMKNRVPMLPSVSPPPPEVEFEVHHMKHRSVGEAFNSPLDVMSLDIDPGCSHFPGFVLVPTILIVGWLDVLQGGKPGGLLVFHRGGRTEFLLKFAAAACIRNTQLCSTAFTRAGAGTGSSACREASLTITFNSATSEILRSGSCS